MTTMKTDMAGGAAVLARAAVDRRVEDSRAGDRAGARPPRTPSARRPTGPATSCGTSAGAPARSPTPTPRDASCWPTRSPTPSRGCEPTVARRRRDADRRDEGRARAAHRRACSRPTDELADAARCAAGAAAGEPLWRLPLIADYERHAALRRSPTPTTRPGNPGAITAALFLQHFTGGRAVGAPRHRRARPARPRTTACSPQGRDRLRCPPARAVGGGPRLSELVLPLVVRHRARRAADAAPTRSRRPPGPCWSCSRQRRAGVARPAIRAWDGSRIRKVVRRARGAEWRAGGRAARHHRRPGQRRGAGLPADPGRRLAAGAGASCRSAAPNLDDPEPPAPRRAGAAADPADRQPSR